MKGQRVRKPSPALPAGSSSSYPPQFWAPNSSDEPGSPSTRHGLDPCNMEPSPCTGGETEVQSGNGRARDVRLRVLSSAGAPKRLCVNAARVSHGALSTRWSVSQPGRTQATAGGRLGPWVHPSSTSPDFVICPIFQGPHTGASGVSGLRFPTLFVGKGETEVIAMITWLCFHSNALQ